MMIIRENKLSEIATKKGINLSKIYSLTAISKLLKQANIPIDVIQRVLNQPSKIRSTDKSD